MPHYTPIVIPKEKLKQHFLTKFPTAKIQIKGSVKSEDVQQQDEGNFEIWFGEGIVRLLYAIVGFQQWYRMSKVDCFYRPLVSFTNCKIGTEKCPGAGSYVNFAKDKYGQSSSLKLSCFEV